jgi:hypothetical protein
VGFLFGIFIAAFVKGARNGLQWGPLRSGRVYSFPVGSILFGKQGDRLNLSGSKFSTPGVQKVERFRATLNNDDNREKFVR